MREHTQSGSGAGLRLGAGTVRRCRVAVRVRWERFQCRISAFYYWRVRFPSQSWVAAGCPPQFRPRLPWWGRFVFAWLRVSGWL